MFLFGLFAVIANGQNSKPVRTTPPHAGKTSLKTVVPDELVIDGAPHMPVFDKNKSADEKYVADNKAAFEEWKKNFPAEYQVAISQSSTKTTLRQNAAFSSQPAISTDQKSREKTK